MEHPREAPTPLFLILLLPFGISSGYASVTLGFLLAKSGMATAAVAAIVSLSVLPQSLKVFWAPLVDNFLTARSWYLLGALLTGLSLLALSAIPANPHTAGLIEIMVILSSVSSTMVSMSAEILMAYGVRDERKGAVSGWSQAGNLGGAGIGGGLALYLAQHYVGWVGGLAVFALCAASCLALLPLEEPSHRHRCPQVLQGFVEIGRDLWEVARSRLGYLVLILMLLPIGSGGAQAVWSAIAGEWHADADIVALVNGVMGGLASLVGALLAGFLCDRADRRTAYCGFGLALVLVAVAMAWLPRTPTVFIGCTLAYAFVLGACYAGYSAAVLEAIGQGAAATKFNLLAAASNVPITIMIWLDGKMHDWWNTTDMLYGEAIFGTVAVAGFGLFVVLTGRLHRYFAQRNAA